MSRKRLLQSLITELPFRKDDVPEIYKIYDRYSVNSKSIRYLQTFHVFSIISGSFLLFHVILHKHYQLIATFKALYIPLFHILFEFMKYVLIREYVHTNDMTLRRNKYVFLLPFYLSCTCFCYIVTVLFGVDLISTAESTFVFSCILSALFLFPLYFHYGIDCFQLLIFQGKPTCLLTQNMQKVSYYCVSGAWFGAFVIPLDWNCDWQRWPVPCIIGSLVGFVLSHIHCVISLKFFYN